MTIPLFKPYYDAREHDYVIQAIRSGWTGLGPKTEEFEQLFASYLGVRHAVMTSSCTAALELALLAKGIGSGDRVAVPTMTFVATAHAVRNVGAYPILCDVEEDTLLLDARCTSSGFRAYIPVLLAGQPFYMAPLEKYCEEYGQSVIYDCAHAVGSAFNAKGRLCCWSFHAVKNLACGEGGMLTTDDDAIAERVRALRWLGISSSTHERSKGQVYKWEYDVTYPGRKAHGNDVAAAIGLSQLEKIDDMQARRQWLWNRYAAQLPNLMLWRPGHSYLLAVIRHPRRDDLARHLSERGIGCGVHYKPLHLTQAYRDRGPFLVADRVWKELLTLPLFPGMTSEQQDTVISAVKEFV